MTNWFIVLAALCGGVALSSWLASHTGPSTASATARRRLNGLGLACALLGEIVVIGSLAFGAARTDAPATAASASVDAQAAPVAQETLAPSGGPIASPAPPENLVFGVEAGSPGQGQAPAARGGEALVSPRVVFAGLQRAEVVPEALLDDSGPIRLQIPVLDIDAPVAAVPIRDGYWDMSVLELGIGWLTTTGVRPGDNLAIAIIAHRTLRPAQPGPFAQLHKIKPGAAIIYYIGGAAYVYTVQELTRARPEEVQRLYVRDGRSLLLVTCTDWDTLERSYVRRLIVRAELDKDIALAEGHSAPQAP